MSFQASKPQTLDLDLGWSSAYLLGNATLDSQHQTLFRIYNKLVEGYSSGDGYQLINTAIGELVGYAQTHFRDEEQIMSRLGYPELKAHKKHHHTLLLEVEAFVSDLDDDKPVLSYEILSFVRQWLIHHIIEEDMKLKPLLGRLD